MKVVASTLPTRRLLPLLVVSLLITLEIVGNAAAKTTTATAANAGARHENNAKYLSRQTMPCTEDTSSDCNVALSRVSLVMLATRLRLQLRQILVVTLAFLTSASLIMVLTAIILGLRIVSIVQLKEF